MKKTLLVLTLGLACVPVLAADFLVVATARTKVESKECPTGRLLVEEAADRDEAKQKRKAFADDDALTDQSYELGQKGRVTLVYSYQGTAAVQPRCQYTKYGAVSGRDYAEARKRLHQKVSEYRKYFLSEPEIVRAWNGEFFAPVE